MNKTIIILTLALSVFFSASSDYDLFYQISPPVEANVLKLEVQESPDRLPVLRETPEQYQELFISVSNEYNIPLEVLTANAQVESQFNPLATSPERVTIYYDGEQEIKIVSRDEGMFQHNSLYHNYFVKTFNYGREYDPYNPSEAIHVTARMVNFYFDRYGHWPDVFLAYNGGAGRVDNNDIKDGSWEYLRRIYSK